MFNPYDIRKRTPKDDEDAIAEFLANGGRITKLRDEVATEYDANLKKLEKEIPGAFNPFSKTDALEE